MQKQNEALRSANAWADLRRQYMGQPLDRDHLSRDPFDQFHTWFDEAIKSDQPDSNAMALATVGPDGHPAVRMVLLKGVDEHGFTFFTNYNSRKGREIEKNPKVAAVFYWHALNRQVRIQGTALKVAQSSSIEYFKSRPRRSQIAAFASPQSCVLESREELEQRFIQCEQQFEGTDVPLPPDWGGFRIEPLTIEFWQGREDRLHDRFQYQKTPTGAWSVHRLAP